MSAAATVADPGSIVRRFWARRLVRIIAVIAVFLLPFTPGLRGWIHANAFVLGWALSSAIVGLSMNVLVGYAGQISLAQAVFFGTGAFTIGNLATSHGVPWLLALPLSGLFTALVALIIGFPALRIRGLHLAIATLGFQFAMQRVIFRAKFFSGGSAGVDVHRPAFSKTWQPFDAGSPSGNTNFLLVILAVLVLVWMIDRNLTRSRVGRAFFALRQDEQVASSFGISVSRYKLLAFAIAGFYAGLAGALFGTLQGVVSNELFDFQYSFEFLVFAVLGGLGSRGGTALGSAFPVLFRNLTEKLKFAGTQLGGMLLVLTLLRYPGGLAAQGRELIHVNKALAKRGARWVAASILAFVISLVLAIVGGRIATVIFEKIFEIVLKAPDEGIVFGILAGLGILIVAIEFSTKQLMHRSGAGTHATELTEALSPSGEASVAEITAEALRRSDITLTFKRPERARASRGVLLEVDNIVKKFGGVTALNEISLEVREGELVGIMGPNGSGKTTMLNCISGFLTPNSGDIRLHGESILKKQPHIRAAQGIGRTFQNIGLAKQETVFDNFVIAQHLVCGYGAFEGLIRTGAVIREERRLKARAQAAVELLGLGDIVNEAVISLPHGRAKLVELGCALVTGPEILLLDEPAAGVSPAEADALGATLKRISSEFGVTILMIEHHVPLMLETCDYIYALDFGQMLTHGEPMEVAGNADVIAAYLGSVGKEATRAVTVGK